MRLVPISTRHPQEPRNRADLLTDQGLNRLLTCLRIDPHLIEIDRIGQPGREAPEVVADCGEHGVGSVADGAGEMVAVHAWSAVEPFLPKTARIGNQRRTDLRDVLNASRYLMRSGL